MLSLKISNLINLKREETQQLGLPKWKIPGLVYRSAEVLMQESTVSGNKERVAKSIFHLTFTLQFDINSKQGTMKNKQYLSL